MGMVENTVNKTRSKTLVVGLDGVPFSLLERLRDKGRIPNMGALFENGRLGRMAVSVPEISSVSWSSFMTGTQAGTHGIFGFMDLEPGTYRMRLPNFTDLNGSTIWEDLAGAGKKTVVINMPATYPAKAINGALISGFVAIDINRAVYPARLIPRLTGMGYRTDLDLARARQDTEFLMEDLNETLTLRRQAVDMLWREIDWDLFIVVVTGTDRLMHYLWDAGEDPDHPYHGAFHDYFESVDRFVGRLYDRFSGMPGEGGGGRRFFMLSDHGFTGIETEVYLNTWLQLSGYLKFQTAAPKSVMDIGPGSTAFAMDPSRIYLNLKGKYPLGAVEKGDYERIRDEIAEGLRQISFKDGIPIAKRVFYREELYRGPFFDQAPDLVVLSRHGCDLKGKVNAPDVFGKTDLQGMHTQDDAFYYASSGMACPSIFDVKQAILASL
jgi:predicted AlkP superfamily phosphohydrolase/phosphomutase